MATIQETFNITGATEIVLEGHGVVTLEQGDQDVMTIETDESVLPKLKTEVRGSRLELGYRSWTDAMFNFGHPQIFYRITVRSLERFSIAGSGNVTTGNLQTDSLQLSIAGSGNYNVPSLKTGSLQLNIAGSGEARISDLLTQDLRVHLPGSGKAFASGSTPRLDLHISGSGKFEGDTLQCDRADVHISGSGRVNLGLTQQLGISISGSGSVSYKGTPSVRQSITGSGRVHQAAAA